MNAEQAMEEIRKESEIGKPMGFQVMSIDEEDIEAYGGSKAFEAFKKLDREKQTEILSRIIDAMYETLEESDEFGFHNLFKMTMWDIEDSNVLPDGVVNIPLLVVERIAKGEQIEGV